MSDEIRDPYQARWAYEHLLVRQPHIPVAGLWFLDGNFFIVCPTADTATALDGEPIASWFYGETPMSPTQLVKSAPEGARRVPDRTAAERASLDSAPRTQRELATEFDLRLTRDFPSFFLEPVARGNAGPELCAVVSAPLDARHVAELERVRNELHWPSPIAIRVDPKASPSPFRPGIPGDIDLIPTRRSNGLSPRLRRFFEEDEDAWSSRRVELFTKGAGPHEFLSDWLATDVSRVVVGTILPPDNLRTWLPIYDQVVLVMPRADNREVTLKALKVSEEELAALAERGRVAFLLPHAIDRYPLPLLEAVVERAPQSMLASRRLAMATVADAQRRLPGLLHSTFSVAEQRALLAVLVESVQKAPSSPQREWLLALIGDISRSWTLGELAIHRGGATATSNFGVGRIAATAFRIAKGRDLTIELLTAATTVEWAAALNATVSPARTEEYSEQAAAEICASAYSGAASTAAMGTFGDVAVALEGLLGIDNDAPALTVAEAFGGEDVRRLREIVANFLQWNRDVDYLRSAIASFNERVRSFEKAEERIVSGDLVALAGAVTGGAIGTAALISTGNVALGLGVAATWVPTAQWLLNRMFSPKAGAALDGMRAANSLTSRDVVLVSRIRRRLRERERPKR